MTRRELLSLVAPTTIEAPPAALADALHDSDASEAPLLVRVFSAIGTWIGAAMVAVFFIATEIYEVVPLALGLALVLFAAAVWLSRRPRRSLALTQVIWALALGAHGLVAASMLELHADETTMALVWTGLIVATMFVVLVPSFQLVSAICVVGFATWLCASIELPFYPLWVALAATALSTAAWVYEVAWARRLGRTWSALAYGLPIAVAGPLTLLGLEDGPAMVAPGWSATVATCALLVLITLVLLEAKRERGEIYRRAYVLGGISVLALIAARHVPGISLSLLWLLVAQLRRSKGLQTIASIQLAGFLFFFYYQLETSLLLKSLWVVSTGAILLVGAWFARPRPADASGEASESSSRRARWLPALGLVVLTSALVVIPTIQKERVLARGETIFLPLAPVDPRSLMQGDYMSLRYALDDEVDEAFGWEPWDEPWADEERSQDPFPRHGRLIVRVDPDGVGHFARFDDGGDLASDELRLEYRVREEWGGRLRIGGESYFFEEGSAAIYEGARYGELVVADDGEVVLVGLRDEQREPLGVRLH